MAGKFYTASPLGLLSDPVGGIGYNDSGEYSSIFSAYSNGTKQVFKASNSGGNNLTPILSPSPHKSEIYDIRTSEIVRKLGETQLDHISLGYADFAYLKNFGVFPNNRLFVARRFPEPVVDDLYSLKEEEKPGKPLSTVIGYMPEEEDFIKLSFNEEWENAEVSFTQLLNDLGKDFGFNLGGGLGNIAEAGANIIPLPGASLLLQRKIMASLGLFGEGVKYVEEDDPTRKDLQGNPIKIGNFRNKDGAVVDVSTIPQGDPNLIKEAKNRTLIGENAPGAGVTCKVSMTLKTTYEQKFISGADPSRVFMDILNNVLQMGTSPATFYLGKQKDAAGNVQKFMNDFMRDPFEKVKIVIQSFIDAFKNQINKLNDLSVAAKKDQENSQETKNQQERGLSDLLKEAIDAIPNYVRDFIKAKYKIKFLGTINALTGGSSTPWHITIGNPLRPIFCSGDMLCKSVSVNFGPQLSFNDLPTFIEVEIQLESARNIGLQEIFSKFNSGGIRVTEGTYQGDYTSGDSYSYWNSDEYLRKGSATSSETVGINTSQEAGPSDETVDATNRNDINNETGSQTKVNEVPEGNGITPNVDTSTQTNPDPTGNPLIASGGDKNSQDLRENETQDQTGDTGGFTDQKNNPTETPNSGQSAPVVNNDNPNNYKKPKYTYSIKKYGPYRYVEVTDESGNIVFTGNRSFSVDDATLIKEAQLNLNDYDTSTNEQYA